MTQAGSLSLRILDRDGFVVRTLVSDREVNPGKIGFEWDGRDDSGGVVPDEAYSLRIGLRGRDSAADYFPANAPMEDVKAAVSYYDRRSGVFSYDLPKPARVHMQAGITAADSKTGKPNGPVLKTLVNREPRPAGPVIENWAGLDETGSYYLPDLTGFAMSVAATTLPENAILAIGNSNVSFAERARSRAGESLLTRVATSHAHHRGLFALDDVSPKLLARPSNARRKPDRRWETEDPVLRGKLMLEGPSAEHFGRQPAALVVFIDDRKVQTVAHPASGMAFEVPLGGLSGGDHIVAFDWASEYGPVAVTSLLVEVPKRPARVASKAGRPEK